MNTATQTRLQTLFQNDGVGNAATLATLHFQPASHPGGTGRATPCNGILDLALRCQNFGMSEADFAKIYNDVTTSTNTYIRGRVNVNTAGADVLTALFMGLNVDEQTASGAAQTLITYRQQNPGQPQFHRVVIDALGNNSPVITALAARRLRHHAQFSIHRRHRGGRAVRARLPAGEIHFRHQRRHADHSLPPGPEPARLGAGRQGAANFGREETTQ